MHIDQEVREELGSLSTEVFGTKYKWLHYLYKGMVERSTTVHRRTQNFTSSKVRYFTLESLKEYMNTQKTLKQPLNPEKL